MKESLKKLQEKLLVLVREKYWSKDLEIKECVEKIDQKIFELKEKREKKNTSKNVVRNLFARISLTTIEFCSRLFTKEMIGHELMKEPLTQEFKNAQSEIDKVLEKGEIE